MAKYRDIGGTTVKFKSGTEEYVYGTSGSGAEGSIYYNSSNGQFEFVGLGTGAWSSGGDLNTGRRNVAGFGTQTAAVFFGGRLIPPPSAKNETEEYNGTSWSEVTDNPTGRIQASIAGSQTAALSAFGATDSNSSVLFKNQRSCTTGFVATPGAREKNAWRWV